MTTLKHTPAPWIGDPQRGNIKSSRGDTICVGVYGADNVLCTAAPDMLKALQKLHAAIGNADVVEVTNALVEYGFPAIAKALGK